MVINQITFLFLWHLLLKQPISAKLQAVDVQLMYAVMSLRSVNIIFPLAIYDLGDVQWLKFPPSSRCSIIKVWKCLVCVCVCVDIWCVCASVCVAPLPNSVFVHVCTCEKEREGDVEWKTRGRRQSLMEGKWGSRSNLFPFFPSTVSNWISD